MPMRVYTEAHASFRVFGKQLDPLTVTIALGLPPDLAHRAGEPRLHRSGKGRVVEQGVYREGLWSMSSKPWVNSPVLSTHLEWLLDQLEPVRNHVRDLLVAGHGVDFFCYSAGTTDRAPSLPKVVRSRADALGAPIDVDHYRLSSGSGSSAEG